MTSPSILHFPNFAANDGRIVAACGKAYPSSASFTSDPYRVTCDRCRKTHVFKIARGPLWDKL